MERLDYGRGLVRQVAGLTDAEYRAWLGVDAPVDAPRYFDRWVGPPAGRSAPPRCTCRRTDVSSANSG